LQDKLLRVLVLVSKKWKVDIRGLLISRSPSAGRHITSCCYFGSSIMLASMSLFRLGILTRD